MLRVKHSIVRGVASRKNLLPILKGRKLGSRCFSSPRWRCCLWHGFPVLLVPARPVKTRKRGFLLWGRTKANTYKRGESEGGKVSAPVEKVAAFQSKKKRAGTEREKRQTTPNKEAGGRDGHSRNVPHGLGVIGNARIFEGGGKRRGTGSLH